MQIRVQMYVAVEAGQQVLPAISCNSDMDAGEKRSCFIPIVVLHQLCCQERLEHAQHGRKTRHCWLPRSSGRRVPRSRREQQPSGRAFDSPKLEAFSRPRSEGGLHRAPLAPHPAFWRLTGIHPLAFGTLESTARFLLMKRATALTPRMTQGQSLLSACSVPTFRCRCLSSIAPCSSALCATYELRPPNASFGDQVAISTARSLARWASTSEQSQAPCIAPGSTTCERALRQAQCHR